MMLLPDLIWTGIGFLFTLMIFSYVLGDNFLFRLAAYIFVGTTAGYVFVLIYFLVILPRLVVPVMQGDLQAGVPAFLGAMLIFKLSPRISRLGSIPMAYLVGVGAAVAVGGAVIGTLFGQLQAAIGMFDLTAGQAQGLNPLNQIVEGAFILFGTLVSLVYFTFGGIGKNGQPVKRPRWVELLAGVGKIFIGITLGALFAGVFSAAAAALVERLGFLADTVGLLIKMAGIS